MYWNVLRCLQFENTTGRIAILGPARPWRRMPGVGSISLEETQVCADTGPVMPLFTEAWTWPRVQNAVHGHASDRLAVRFDQNWPASVAPPPPGAAQPNQSQASRPESVVLGGS